MEGCLILKTLSYISEDLPGGLLNLTGLLHSASNVLLDLWDNYLLIKFTVYNLKLLDLLFWDDRSVASNFFVIDLCNEL